MELQAGDPDAARRLFQEGVWADPGSRDVVFIFHAWATLEWRCGNAPLARELFKSALKVEPRSENTWATWIAVRGELLRLLLLCAALGVEGAVRLAGGSF